MAQSWEHFPLRIYLEVVNLKYRSNLCGFVNNERQKEKLITLLYSKRFIVCPSLLRLMKIHKNHLQCKNFHDTKKWGFPLTISSVNETNSAFSCTFGHIYWRYIWWKTSFFVQCLSRRNVQMGRRTKSKHRET